MTQLLPPKKEVALALLERSNVDVYLDPRAKGVVVPPQFRKEPRLILKIGLNMPVPIPDLRLDDESMSCTLSFNRRPFFCVVPWMSVFAMVGEDGRGMVWPDDMPQELAVRVAEEQRRLTPVRDEPSSSPGSERTPSSKSKARQQGDAPRESERDVASTDRATKSKRSKKKKEEGAAPPARPVLVAIPSPEKSSPRVESLDERRENPPPPAPPRGPSGPGTRPKRELPPYLRVVK